MTDAGKGCHGGIASFLVESGSPGFSAGGKIEKMGFRTSAVGDLVFQDMYVSSDNVLGKAGGGAAVFATAMDWERSLLVAGYVGIMGRLLETSVAYAKTRT